MNLNEILIVLSRKKLTLFESKTKLFYKNNYFAIIANVAENIFEKLIIESLIKF